MSLAITPPLPKTRSPKFLFFFSSRRRHTRYWLDWSSDVCSSDLGALAVRPPGGGAVGSHRVGGEEEDVAVAAAGEHDDVGEVGLDLTGDHVADDDPAGAAVDHDQLHHLVSGVAPHCAGRDLTLQRLIGADQQLLAGLATRVEGAGDLHPAERPVVEQTAVLPREGDALGDALV